MQLNNYLYTLFEPYNLGVQRIVYIKLPASRYIPLPNFIQLFILFNLPRFRKEP